MQYDDDDDAPVVPLTQQETELAEADARGGCALCSAALAWAERGASASARRAQAAEQRAAEQRAAEQRAAEQRAAEQRAAEQAEREARYWRAERSFSRSLRRHPPG